MDAEDQLDALRLKLTQAREVIREMHSAVCRNLGCPSRDFYGDELADAVERQLNGGFTDEEMTKRWFDQIGDD